MKSRDEAAYVEYVGGCQDRLRRTAYLMTGDWALASDITQEVLIKLYVAWPRLDRGPGLPTYVRRTIMSSVIDLKRKQKRRREDVIAEPETLPIGDGSDGRADRDALMRALTEVPPRQRACVVLRYFEELSIAETAEILKCSEGNVKSQTARALDALRRLLDDAAWIGPIVAELEGAR
ncbi:MAG: SigE family RNA polymerase sigma factor [Nocardioidaceae bacterium]|nr:SigE family RNA polymerase sigma factor [Nocardioidaceae bacterium]MCL2613551.1 SigE family RNA polymerase sigma factor [Nocardioidaceae bacterium]